VFLLNSRLSLVSVAIMRSLTTTLMAPLIPKLRGYFAEFLSESYLNALACSASPPVSVCGTITVLLARSFSSQRELNCTHFSVKISKPITPQDYDFADLPTISPSTLNVTSIHHGNLSSCVTPSLYANSGAGIFNLLSIAYSNWPRLRYRLTRSG
jgi:hypothetical protein